MNFFSKVKQAAKIAIDSSGNASFYMNYSGKKLMVAEGGARALVSYRKTTTYNEAKHQGDAYAASQIIAMVAQELDIENDFAEDVEEYREYLNSLEERAEEQLEKGSRGNDDFVVIAKAPLSGSFRILPEEAGENELANAIKYGKNAPFLGDVRMFKAEVFSNLDQKIEDSVVYVILPQDAVITVER